MRWVSVREEWREGLREHDERERFALKNCLPGSVEFDQHVLVVIDRDFLECLADDHLEGRAEDKLASVL